MAKPSLFDTDQGDEPGLPDVPRLRKVPVVVTQLDLDAIKDAISLKRAMLSHWTMKPSDGDILAMICSEWTKAESARLSGKGGA
jgi:hypothetical protein